MLPTTEGREGQILDHKGRRERFFKSTVATKNMELRAVREICSSVAYLASMYGVVFAGLTA
jgi:hypothetical protein